MDPARRAGSWAAIWTIGWLLLLSLLLPESESVARRERRGHSGRSKEESAPTLPPLNGEGCGKNLLSRAEGAVGKILPLGTGGLWERSSALVVEGVL